MGDLLEGETTASDPSVKESYQQLCIPV